MCVPKSTPPYGLVRDQPEAKPFIPKAPEKWRQALLHSK